MKLISLLSGLLVAGTAAAAGTNTATQAASNTGTNTVAQAAGTNTVTDLGKVVVEGSRVSKYRNETVATATYSDEKPEETPVAVDVLTKDFIREQNATDLHDLMRYVPGIFTGGKTLMDRQPGLYDIRGMGGNGATLGGTMPVAGGMGMFLDPYMLDSVEVVKGPVGSTLGGIGGYSDSNGAGGSINLMLKRAQLDQDAAEVATRASVGKHLQRYRGMVDINDVAVADKLAFRLAGVADYGRPFYLPNGYRWRESYSLAPSFVWQVTEDLKIGLDTTFQYTDMPSYQGIPIYRGHPVYPYTWDSTSCKSDQRMTYKGYSIQPWIEYALNKHWTVKGGAGYAYSDTFFNLSEPGMYNPSTGTYTGTYTFPTIARKMNTSTPVSTSISGGNSTITHIYNGYGRLIGRHDNDEEGLKHLGNTFVSQTDAGRTESTSGRNMDKYGIFAQDTISWWWFRVLGGLRYDHHVASPYSAGSYSIKSCSSDSVSPRVGLSLVPTDWLVFYGNYSQTRTPTFGYLRGDGSALTDPWTAQQYEGGVRVRTGEDFWIGLAAFRIDQENTPVAVDYLPNTTTYYYSQIGKSTSKGVELSASGNITKNWSAYAAYTYIEYEDKSEDALRKSFDRYPPNSLTLSTSYKMTYGWLEDIVVGGSYRFRERYCASFRGAYVDPDLFFNSSHVFDVNVDMPLSKFGGPKNWTLTLACKNIFDANYIESNRHFYECFPGDPRTFEIGLRAQF